MSIGNCCLLQAKERFFSVGVGKQSLQPGHELGRQGRQFSFAIDGGMHGVAFDKELLLACGLIFPEDLVAELAGNFFQFSKPGFDDKQVVIAGRGLEAGIAFDDREEETQFFYFFIGADVLPHEFGAANLKKAEVIGVIDDGCGVGISVEDPVVAAISFLFQFFVALQIKFIFFGLKPQASSLKPQASCLKAQAHGRRPQTVSRTPQVARRK